MFTPFSWVVVIVCLLPTLLNCLGLDFSIPTPASDLAGPGILYPGVATEKPDYPARGLRERELFAKHFLSNIQEGYSILNRKRSGWRY
jgi:hypothetical protein